MDECKEKAIACPGLNEACINEEGSFRCECAEGFIRRDSICVENLPLCKCLNKIKKSQNYRSQYKNIHLFPGSMEHISGNLFFISGVSTVSNQISVWAMF